jgi:hypothetical protein
MKKYQSAFSSVKPIIKDHSLINHEAIKEQLTILEELRDLIPALINNERKQLEENIKTNGCREALIVWETDSQSIGRKPEGERKFILIDGHNRYSICKENDVDFKINLQSFSSLSKVRDFMIDNQLGRRNLNPEQMAYLRGLKYSKNKNKKGKYDRENHKGQNVPYASTAEELAKKFNVSSKTIKRDAVFADGLAKLIPALRNDILSGNIKVSKKAIQEIAKQDAPSNSVEEIEEIGVPAKQEIPDVSVEFTELKSQLFNLVSKLSDTKSVDKTCNKIIEITAKIKRLIA